MDDALTALDDQQRELAALVSSATTEELACPSRCDGWSVADVLRLMRTFA